MRFLAYIKGQACLLRLQLWITLHIVGIPYFSECLPAIQPNDSLLTSDSTRQVASLLSDSTATTKKKYDIKHAAFYLDFISDKFISVDTSLVIKNYNLTTSNAIVVTNLLAFDSAWVKSRIISDTLPSSFFSLQQDLTLSPNDSINLELCFQQENIDSLELNWFKNGARITNHFSSSLMYVADSIPDVRNNVTVIITRAHSDAVLVCVWHITIVPLLNSPFSHSFLPRQEKIITRQDSIEFSVFRHNTFNDSLVYSWYLNNTPISNQNRPTYYYTTDSLVDKVDTITVKIHHTSPDTIIQHDWLVGFVSRKNFVSPISFSPFHPTISNQGDSILFKIALLQNDNDSLTFTWLVNGSLFPGVSDSVFTYYSNRFTEKTDTISVNIESVMTHSTVHHEWYILHSPPVELLPEIICYPVRDTVVTAGDSIQFEVVLTNVSNDSVTFDWFINNQLAEAHHGARLYYHADILLNEPAIISVAIRGVIPDSTITHFWTVRTLAPTPDSLIFIFSPTNDTTMTAGDTVLLSFHYDQATSKAPAIQWFVNHQAVTGKNEPTFSFLATGLTKTPDTVSVAIAHPFLDSTITHHWLITTQTPFPTITYSPANDLSCTASDTVRLSIHVSGNTTDSLAFSWFYNGSFLPDETDSNFHFIANHFSDTITVAIHDLSKDSLVEHQWLIQAQPAIVESYRFIFSPALDTTIVQGDAIAFAVHCEAIPTDSLRFKWFVNGEFFNNDSAAIFLHSSKNLLTKTDTVVAMIHTHNGDSIATKRWIITNKLKNHAPYIISYTPKQDTTITAGDSISLAIVAADIDHDSLHYQWFLNDTTLQQAHGFALTYNSGDFADSTNVISVHISDADTTISWSWHIVSNYQNKRYIPCPKLIYPAEASELSEDDFFTWHIDSSFISENLPFSSIFQIAEDSLFHLIISTDTCFADSSIAFDQITGFHKLKKEKEYYWRVKVRLNSMVASAFTTSKRKFYYQPEFVELIKFNAALNIEVGIILDWQTNYERNNAGFNIYRSPAQSTSYTRINETLITGTKMYSFLDQNIRAGETVRYRLEEISLNGKSKTTATISINIPLPENYNLYQNYPNPFNTLTLFKYEIPIRTRVTIVIFNVLGRQIKTLIDDIVDPGFYTITWDGRDGDGVPVVSGLYFYQMYSSAFHSTRKMAVVR